MRILRLNKLGIALIVFLVLFFGVIIGFYIKENRLQDKQNPFPISEVDIVDSVGKLIVLPKDEIPTIATVSDLKILESQPFFSRASIGDKVLIYTNAQKAIIYSPSRNVIIEVAPLNIEPSN